MKNTKTYSSALGVERSGQAERSEAGPTAVGIGHPNPEVVAKAKRRIFTGEYKQRVLEEADPRVSCGIENLLPGSAKRFGGFFPGTGDVPSGPGTACRALVKVCLPSPQGTSSTTTAPQRRQSPRRMAYNRKTKNPQKGMNSKRRSGMGTVKSG